MKTKINKERINKTILIFSKILILTKIIVITQIIMWKSIIKLYKAKMKISLIRMIFLISKLKIMILKN
jgi:hypothetical protein